MKLIIFLIFLVQIVSGDEHDHKYSPGDEVVLWYNTVGEYHNPTNVYHYYSLPFCMGSKKGLAHSHETFGEALLGIELAPSGLHIDFLGNVANTPYCSIILDERKLKAFIYAVKNYYIYQAFLDDIPLWSMVGDISEDENKKESSYYIWTHKKLEIGYNNDRIVDVNLISEHKQKLELNANITFSYEVIWKKSDISFDDRFNKLLDASFFKHKIHWFSIFNSFMMVIFLIGLVSMILLRTLRKDYARYSRDDDCEHLDLDLGDEYGWKQINGEVFRPPFKSMLFSCLIGTGAQVAVVTFLVIIFAIVFELYTERGTLLTTAIFVYAVSSPINGYFGGSLYAQYNGRKWIKQMLMSAFLLPSLICGTAFFINFIAIYYHAAKAIPFGSMMIVMCICFFIILPLTLVGTLLGRSLAGQPNNPCRVSSVPRPIPEKKWFMDPLCIISLGGILPFASIFIEMYFIFTSFWAYKIYYVYGFMLLVFLILAVVTVCVTIVATYFMLNAEDYRWQWTSFLSGASSAFYVYLYAVYYFFFKTKMYGMFQTVFYFGYMALFSLGLGIMCGTFGYIGTQAFVRKIYSIKID